MKKRIVIILFVFTVLFQTLYAAGISENACGNHKTATPVKYMFLFIGDGMSLAQVSSAEIFTALQTSDDFRPKRLNFSQFPVTGLATTCDASSFITDSASAATAIATGNKTLSGVINMDTDKKEKFKTIAEYAHDAGMKVGIVSSVTINHATPAAFYAKVPSRNDFYDIALQLVQSNFEYFGGGCIDQRKGENGLQQDAVEIALANGYTYVDTHEAFNNLGPGTGKVIVVSPVLQDSGTMPYEIDRKPHELSLADFTRKGIELLDNPRGFFMMVEGGKIDWACHANDAATVIRDVLALDEAVKEAIDFAKQHPAETLIVVTGDHETGGMSLGFSSTQYSVFPEKIALQKLSYVAFNEEVLEPYRDNTRPADAKLEDILPAIKESFGIDFESLTVYQKQQLEFAFQRSMGDKQIRAFAEDNYILYGGYEPLTVKITQIVAQTSGIGWTSYSHTGLPVPVFAFGGNHELFSGYYDNTDLFRKMFEVMDLQ